MPADKLFLLFFITLEGDVMADQKLGNPAVVGLAGFGITTVLLQLHNLGFAGTGIVFCTAIMFGGLAQLVAVFLNSRQETISGSAHFVLTGHSG